MLILKQLRISWYHEQKLDISRLEIKIGLSRGRRASQIHSVDEIISLAILKIASPSPRPEAGKPKGF